MTHDEIRFLEGDALDCAVAVAQRWELCDRKGSFNSPLWKIHDDIYSDEPMFVDCYRPSVDGSQLLEIMAREKIGVYFDDIKQGWIASIVKYEQDTGTKIIKEIGKTINEAVLRCYLLSKQGGNNELLRS